MSKRNLFQRLPAAYARRMARWFGRRLHTLSHRVPIVTFTFDDFPETALTEGGRILKDFGSEGTYYISLGLMGQETPTGTIFRTADLEKLIHERHDVGCHTFHHCPAWETQPVAYQNSVVENARAFAQLDGKRTMQTHSYPISYPRPNTKRRIEARFRACRGGGQTFNQGTVDLNYLSSFFLEQSRDNFGAVERVIAANAESRGWLVFSTHDITTAPTRFGCQPAFFERVVRSSAASGAKILTMSAALDALGIETAR